MTVSQDEEASLSCYPRLLFSMFISGGCLLLLLREDVSCSGDKGRAKHRMLVYR
jgi:hypothetical protein